MMQAEPINTAVISKMSTAWRLVTVLHGMSWREERQPRLQKLPVVGGTILLQKILIGEVTMVTNRGVPQSEHIINA